MTNANGVSNTNVTLTINPVPVVTGVSPNAGFETNTVTVYGYNLSSPSAVNFGGIGASIISNKTSITVIAPTPSNPASQTTVDVTVTASGNTSTTSSADWFTYYSRPVVSSVSPGSGYNGDVITVYFTTSGTWNYNWVQIGGTTVIGSGTINGNYIQLTAPIPSVGWGGGNESINIDVTQGGASVAPWEGNFWYNGEGTPTTSSYGDYGNGWILVYGLYFSNVTAAAVNGSGVSYTKLSDTQVQVQVPSSDIDTQPTIQIGNSLGWGAGYNSQVYGQATAMWSGSLVSGGSNGPGSHASGGVNDPCFTTSSDAWRGQLSGSQYTTWSFGNGAGGSQGG